MSSSNAQFVFNLCVLDCTQERQSCLPLRHARSCDVLLPFSLRIFGATFCPVINIRWRLLCDACLQCMMLSHDACLLQAQRLQAFQCW